MEPVEDQYSFNQYANAVNVTAAYPLLGANMVYPAMGLAGEAGEYLDKVKKTWRNRVHDARALLYEHTKKCLVIVETDLAVQGMSAADLPEATRVEMVKELGDVLWYLNACARELGVTLCDVARLNAEKVLSRRQRGVVCSQGDNR